MLRWTVKWLAIVSIIVGTLYAAGIYTQDWLKNRYKTKFNTTAITRGRVETVVNSTGTLKPVRSISVGAFISGPISEIHADFNSVIKKGQLLARIDPRLFIAQVERDKATLATAKAEVSRVEALLQQAKNNEMRARKLVAINKEYLSDAELDQFVFNRQSLDAQLEVAKANVKQAEASLANSTTNLSYTDILSPVDGIVIERKVDDGQTVASQFQTPEMFIVAPDMDKQMYVFASVDEADIGQIRSAQERNQPVRFTVDAYPDDVFTGKIHQIRKNHTTTQNVVTYPVVIETTNPDLKLLPGMTASISFQIEARESVLRIPAAALRFVPSPAIVHPEDQHHLQLKLNPPEPARLSVVERAELGKRRQKRVLWIAEGELLRAKPVTLGLNDTQHAELLEGDLKEGDLLVTGTERVFKTQP